MMKTDKTHLYVHVPFCAHICGYCDFAHTVYSEETAERWLNALKTEMEHRDFPEVIDTVYIGGGTPTSLSHDLLERFLCMLDGLSSHACEYTVEINPETLDEKKCEILKRHGIGRASIGFQTSDERLLKLMGRHHTMDDMRRCVNMLRKHGIEDISLDLMYSLPFQTMDILTSSAADALSLHPSHLSLYSLTVEEGTMFERKGYTSLDEDSEADMYEWLCEILPRYGYRQYEVSNFCKEGHASRHNIGYWHYDDFIGLGCGASGKENHMRYDHVKNVFEYIRNPLHKEEIALTREDEMFENLMMGVRMKEGMDTALFEKRYGISFMEAYGDVFEPLHKQGYMDIMNDRLVFSETGYPIMNSLLVDFLKDE